MKRFAFLLGTCLAFGFTPATHAAAPAAASLKAEIIPGTNTYELDPAMAGKEFVDKVQAAEKADRPPATRPPKVNLTLRLTNTGSSDVSLSIGGDESSVDLELKGPGALSIAPRLAMTMEFRMGTPVRLKPGDHRDIPISSLASGPRQMGKFSYWTEPGDYTLAATFNGRSAQNPIKVTSEPIPLKVTARAAK